MVGNLDIGKLITIVLFFFIAAYFFGDKIIFWYEHQDDMKLNLSKIVYTENDFNELSHSDQSALIQEVATTCINKHHLDKLNCDDTFYWLGHSLEKKGVQRELAISWMQPCKEACLNGTFDPIAYEAMNPISDTETDKKKEKSKGTKWIWEK